jgi:hypothetical protein
MQGGDSATSCGLKDGNPPPVADAGTQSAIGDVGTSASPRVIDVDPISAMLGGAEEDLVKDQARTDQALKGPGTSDE